MSNEVPLKELRAMCDLALLAIEESEALFFSRAAHEVAQKTGVPYKECFKAIQEQAPSDHQDLRLHVFGFINSIPKHSEMITLTDNQMITFTNIKEVGENGL